MVFGAVPTFVRFDTCYPSPPMARSDQADSEACTPRTAAGTGTRAVTREGSIHPSSVSPALPALLESGEVLTTTGPSRRYSSVQQSSLEQPQAVPTPSSQALSTEASTNRSIANQSSKSSFRPHVLVSCEPCKTAHVKCQQKRPCERCVRRGIQNDCIDVVHKERGRPPKDPEKARAKAAGRLAEEARSRTRSTIEKQPVPTTPLLSASYDDRHGYDTMPGSNLDRRPDPRRSMIAYGTINESQEAATPGALPPVYSSHPPTPRHYGYFHASASSQYPSPARRHPSYALYEPINSTTAPPLAAEWRNRQTPTSYPYGQPLSPRYQYTPLSQPRPLDPLPPPPAQFSRPPSSKPAAVEPTQHADPSRNLRGIQLSRSDPHGIRQVPPHEQQRLQLPPLRMSSVMSDPIGATAVTRSSEQGYIYDRSSHYAQPPSAHPYPQMFTPSEGYPQAPSYYTQHAYNQHYRPDQPRYAALQEQRYPQPHDPTSPRREAEAQRPRGSTPQDPRRRSMGRDTSQSQSHLRSTGQVPSTKAKTRTYNERDSASSSSGSHVSAGQSSSPTKPKHKKKKKKKRRRKGKVDISDLVD